MKPFQNLYIVCSLTLNAFLGKCDITLKTGPQSLKFRPEESLVDGKQPYKKMPVPKTMLRQSAFLKFVLHFERPFWFNTYIIFNQIDFREETTKDG